MLLVQLGNNSPGGSSNFGKISKHHEYIPNCTRHRMITYTNNNYPEIHIQIRKSLIFKKV